MDDAGCHSSDIAFTRPSRRSRPARALAAAIGSSSPSHPGTQTVRSTSPKRFEATDVAAMLAERDQPIKALEAEAELLRSPSPGIHDGSFG